MKNLQFAKNETKRAKCFIFGIPGPRAAGDLLHKKYYVNLKHFRKKVSICARGRVLIYKRQISHVYRTLYARNRLILNKLGRVRRVRTKTETARVRP